MKKVGILGGTFNPVHHAHLAMAQAAMDQYKLDKVLFMPSKNPPHKDKSQIVSDEHRTRMIQLAIAGIPGFSFSDFELRREGITYTSDTLSLLKEKHPDWDIYFIIGGDSLLTFEQWHKPEKILQYGTVLATPRKGIKYSETEKLCKKLSHRLSGNLFPFRMKQQKISSRQIRKKIKKGEALTGLCPERVSRYIRLHGLYGSQPFSYPPGCLEKQDIYNCLSSTLKPGRYYHTLGVADTAVLLACCHGYSSEEELRRAETAGLLHDCAKYFTEQEQISLCEKEGIEISPVERKNPALLHGKLGAFLAETRYGIQDKEILSAIRYHTTGRPDMSVLEKIIYVADYMEPNRHMDCTPYSLREVRKTCFQDLDRGVFMIMENTLHYLSQNDTVIDEMTARAYEYYAARVKSR